ncbi:uncharacterized protein LOC119305858 [Triticum dicoccoides]|uniref:uncharacterized protein LOC119305858 n=1 Tax=Triticum dicoccoides TaxID=85692 RepID=UPI00188E8A96|nr:uncharacterized protein LOC119305858 [Triticum dicoccoides]
MEEDAAAAAAVAPDSWETAYLDGSMSRLFLSSSSSGGAAQRVSSSPDLAHDHHQLLDGSGPAATSGPPHPTTGSGLVPGPDVQVQPHPPHRPGARSWALMFLREHQ